MKNFTAFVTVFAGLVFFHSIGLSQNNQSTGDTTTGIAGFWEIETAGGRFVARLDQISSVSQHEYLIDGTVKVYECTVSTDGGYIARFYYIEPVGAGNSTISGSNTVNRIKDVANKVTDKAGLGDAELIVTKHYPDTTHAKTSEYRFKNKDTIGRIYDHAHRVWAEERGRGKENKITIRE